MIVANKLSSLIALVSIGLLLVIFVLTLHWMGRIPICTCGFGIATMHAWSAETSQHFADPYSFSHLLHGILFFLAIRLIFPRMPLRFQLLLCVGIEVGWEIFENTPFIINRYRAATASLDYTGDSILNSVGDVFFCVLGFWLASRLSWKWILAVVVLVELLMLATIKDNLTLNILMLVYPVQWIREWQMVR